MGIFALTLLLFASEPKSVPVGCEPDSPVRDPQVCAPLVSGGDRTIYSMESVAFGSVNEMNLLRVMTQHCGLSNRIDHIGSVGLVVYDIFNATIDSRECVRRWIDENMPENSFSEERFNEEYEWARARALEESESSGAVLAHSYYSNEQSPTGGKTQKSDFREGVEVEYLYRQDLEGVYWTTWFGREEKREGDWREIYYETSEKGVKHGILRFQCFALDSIGDPTITIFDFGVSKQDDFENPTNARVIVIERHQRQAWKSSQIEELRGYDPPFELFVVAHYRFCDQAA